MVINYYQATDCTNTIDVYYCMFSLRFYGYINKTQMYNYTFLFPVLCNLLYQDRGIVVHILFYDFLIHAD